jgi:hypothetical protein
LSDDFKSTLIRPIGRNGKGSKAPHLATVHKMPMYCTVRIEKGAFHMTKPRLRLVTPATVNRTVTLRRPRNGEVRTREHLTEDEVEKLIEGGEE